MSNLPGKRSRQGANEDQTGVIPRVYLDQPVVLRCLDPADAADLCQSILVSRRCAANQNRPFIRRSVALEHFPRTCDLGSDRRVCLTGSSSYTSPGCRRDQASGSLNIWKGNRGSAGRVKSEEKILSFSVHVEFFLRLNHSTCRLSVLYSNRLVR